MWLVFGPLRAGCRASAAILAGRARDAAFEDVWQPAEKAVLVVIELPRPQADALEQLLYRPPIDLGSLGVDPRVRRSFEPRLLRVTQAWQCELQPERSLARDRLSSVCRVEIIPADRMRLTVAPRNHPDVPQRNAPFRGVRHVLWHRLPQIR
jgi:hypothetical protein